MDIETRPRQRRNILIGLIVVLLAAGAVRGYLVATTEIVSRDGITFTKYAQGLRTDPVGEMRRQDQHPLYPATLLAAYSLVGPWLADEPVHAWPLAGQIASLLGGLLVVWAAYALGRAMWDERVGLTTALFAAMLPELCQVSANALSDGLHLGLYLWGLVALLGAMRANRLGRLAAAAILSGLAFLVRPEGGSILAVGLAMVLTVGRGQGWPLRRRAAGVAILLACFFAVASPYMLAVGSVIQKKNVFELFGLDDLADASAPTGPIAANRSSIGSADYSPEVNAPVRGDLFQSVPVQVLYFWGRACRVVYLLLALPALAMQLVPRPRGLKAIAIAALLHLSLVYALASSYGYLSLRHLLTLAVLTLPFAAATFVWIVDQASVRLAFGRDRRARFVRPLVYLVGVVVVVAPTVPWMLRPIGGGKGYLVAAGRWLHHHSQPGELVFTSRSRVAYYAERPMRVAPDTGSVKKVLAGIKAIKPDYYVVDQVHITAPHRNPDFFAGLESRPLRRRLELIHEEPGPTGKVVIYRVKQIGK